MTPAVLIAGSGIISVVSCFVGAYIERHIVKKPVKKYAMQPIVKYTLEPVEFKFEHEWNPKDEALHGLSPEEAAWQRRRIIASKVTDYFFTELMRENNEISETVIHPQQRHDMEPYITTTYIRVMRPVKI